MKTKKKQILFKNINWQRILMKLGGVEDKSIRFKTIVEKNKFFIYKKSKTIWNSIFGRKETILFFPS